MEFNGVNFPEPEMFKIGLMFKLTLGRLPSDDLRDMHREFTTDRTMDLDEQVAAKMRASGFQEHTAQRSRAMAFMTAWLIEQELEARGEPVNAEG